MTGEALLDIGARASGKRNVDGRMVAEGWGIEGNFEIDEILFSSETPEPRIACSV